MIDGWNVSGGEFTREGGIVRGADEMPRVLVSAIEVQQVNHSTWSRHGNG